MSTVWIVQVDKRRDYSAAEAFGEIKEIFSSIGRAFDPDGAIDHARRVLSKVNPDDYLVMSGDPALCAISVTVAAEYQNMCNILRWDKNKLIYEEMSLKF
jgi:hypothetical protein